MEDSYLKKILDKLDLMEIELKELTSKIDTLNAKDLPARMNRVENKVSGIEVKQAKVYAGITVIAFLVPIALKFIKL